ncbi:N-acetylmuramoyl-L-alanine amidase [Mycobacterium intracellulare]|uniref:N-acetylmuramoyl-L-alanine amidase n=1 Tax=Mycobacterium intracellulare TaxID=1767 RepID=UPI002599133D|nr:N-acetylmuramoyl-L-alanine amidase [Mycobacterium intracellulare]MDM3894734.1 N-acetylmuramoyl-L-alanine amidase [Mycobacterium intracellulare]
MTATKDQVAQIIVGEAKARNHTRDECLAEMSALYQESGWDETIWDPTHTTYGVAQQDGSYPNRFQGAAAQVKAFFDKLDVKRASPGHGDIWLNICWLQQAPSWPSAQYWYDNGRRAYLTEIQSRISTVTPYLDKYWPAGGTVTAPTDSRLTALQAVRPDFNEFPMWCDNNQDRGGTKADLFLLHTQEPGSLTDDDAAVHLAQFLIDSAGGGNPVSYHYTVRQARDGGVTVVDVVDTDYASWSVGNSNNRAINLCFAGSGVGWSQDDWMTQSKAINVAAYLAVQDCIKYDIDPTVIPGPQYGKNPPGISDHRYCTEWLKDGNNHNDVGDNFPWGFFTAAVAKYWAAANNLTQPTPTEPTKPDEPQTFEQWLATATTHDIATYAAAQLGPGDPAWRNKGETLRDNLWDGMASVHAKLDLILTRLDASAPPAAATKTPAKRPAKKVAKKAPAKRVAHAKKSAS